MISMTKEEKEQFIYTLNQCVLLRYNIGLLL